MPFVFGEPFRPAADAFQGLLPTVWLATLFWLCQPLLLASTRSVDLFGPSLAGFAAALATASLAIPRFGVPGAVLSNVAGFVTLAATAVALAARPPERRS